MAIKIKKNNSIYYAKINGLLTTTEIKKADKLDIVLQKKIKKLERKLIDKGFLTKEGVKKNTLRIWYDFGKLLNKIGTKYKIIGSIEEEYYWRAIYDYLSPVIKKGPIPQKSLNWKENHFRICSLLAKRNWREVKKLKFWAIWKDIFDNKKILEDERVFNLVVSYIIDFQNKGFDHKQIRLFLYKVSSKIKNLETGVLTEKEIKQKFNEILTNG